MGLEDVEGLKMMVLEEEGLEVVEDIEKAGAFGFSCLDVHPHQGSLLFSLSTWPGGGEVWGVEEDLEEYLI